MRNLNLSNKTGKLFIISGPSGVGKGTLREIALKKFQNLVYSISCTTRKPREGEQDGVQYRFISHEKFEEYIQKNLFLEYAHVHSGFYGTLKQDVINALNAGQNVLLEIDVQGALKVLEKMPEAILIFVVPPSLEVLEQRLINRHTEGPEELKIRLANARKELALKDQYKYVLVNGDLEKAAEELEKIFAGEQ